MRRRPVGERFWEKVVSTHPDECWEWTGSTDSCGYGTFNRGVDGGGGTAVAHRWAYEHAVGPIPDGMEIDHLCRNRACVNPEHLEPVTHLENVRRGGPGGPGERGRKTHCKQGHPFAGDNLIIRANSKGRDCRECNRQAVRRYLQRKEAIA